MPRTDFNAAGLGWKRPSRERPAAAGSRRGRSAIAGRKNVSQRLLRLAQRVGWKRWIRPEAS